MIYDHVEIKFLIFDRMVMISIEINRTKHKNV